jgi:translation elongation factor EF-Tu-like GTPase
MMENRSQVRAKVTFLTSAQGGRLTPAISGYKPQLKVGDVFTSCFVWGDTRDQLFAPGVEYRVHLQLPLWQDYQSQIIVGMRVQLQEGSRIVAEGIITEML